MILYHLKTCDTCRKAVAALKPRSPTLVDIRAEGVPRATLQGWLDKLGPDLLVNRKSTTWRGLSEAERAAPPLDLLLAHPTLMKRPVIVDGNTVHVGWGPAVRAALGVA